MGEYNGRLDGQNFPVETIDKLKLAPPTLTSQSTLNVFGFKHVGQTQDYHFVRRWNTYEQGLPVHKPLFNFDLQNNSWSSGWNNLCDIDSAFNDLVLDFDAESGTLHGCFDINFRHGIDVLQFTEELTGTFGNDWWSRWGLFCNDVLVAETGRVYPRLSNLSVPYKLFVGSQPVRLELRWQTNNTTTSSTSIDTPISRMEIYGASIWCCNTKR